MKKIKIIIATLCVAAIGVGIFYACQKEKENVNNNIDCYQKTNFNFDSILVSDGMLVFPSMAYVNYVLESLNYQITEWNNYIYGLYGEFDDSTYNAILDSLEINDNQPLIDFEDNFDYTSLRKVIEEEELVWEINNDGEDISDEPDNHFIIDYAIRTLLNTNLQIKIGDTIYEITPDGYNIINFGENINSIYNSKSLNGCSSGVFQSGISLNNQGTGGIGWSLAHHNYPWRMYVMARSKNYHKKNGCLSSYRDECEVRIYGYVSGPSNDCSVQVDVNPSNASESRRAKFVTQRITVYTFTMSYWIHAYYKGADMITVQALI